MIQSQPWKLKSQLHRAKEENQKENKIFSQYMKDQEPIERKNTYEQLSPIERNSQLRAAYLLYPKIELRKPASFDREDFDPGLLDGVDRDTFYLFDAIERNGSELSGNEYDPDQVAYSFLTSKRHEHSEYLKLWEQNHQQLMDLSEVTPYYKDFIKKHTRLLAPLLRGEELEDYFHLGLGLEGTSGIYSDVTGVELERQGYFHELRTVGWLMEEREREEKESGTPSDAYEKVRVNIVDWRQSFIEKYKQEP